jgi:uncharacterized protein YyaL (SSP411 family)
MSRLSQENSAYLKHSADQKIDWYPWSETAFEKAREEDKPLFLSSGGVWCHWCHVMAKECFYDDEIAGILNDHFISIKLDRDERPDIDRRYQKAVSAMGGGGGWPLSVFLTHDRKPFFGGTYFPPQDRHGRPGFNKVLQAVLNLYNTKRDDITAYTGRLLNAISSEAMKAGSIDESIISAAIEDILKEFDPQNGGFGVAPKFPMPAAMEFLINRYCIGKDESVGLAVRKTLESMAAGGFYDHLGGGFHRYSTDEAWIIPHFEKMADDNALLLRNYLDAYSVFGDPLFRDVSKGIIRFVKDVLSDPEGGFYSSQDADVTPDDEGGYFTWSDEDFKGILDEEEYPVLSLYFFHDRAVMHHDNSKKVLFAVMDAEEIATKYGMPAKEVIEIIQRGKAKLLEERNSRETPFIDKTLYTSLNGMMISSFLKGYRILKDEKLKDYALKTLERIFKKFFIDGELYHSAGVKALFDDYVYLIDSCVAAYEATGMTEHIVRAEELMRLCIDKFWDREEDGFFDSVDHVLGLKIKAIEDIPHPSANSLSIILFLKLSLITDNSEYRDYAEKSLRVFAGRAGEMAIHGGYFFCALDAYFNSLKITLNTSPDSELALSALSCTAPYTQLKYGDDSGTLVPCIGSTCYEPVYSPENLRDFFLKQKYNTGINK